jgi:uncharacterized membrane protein
MVDRINRSRTDKNALLLLWGSAILTLLGLVDSVYLLIFKLTGNSQMCLGNGGCHNVNVSPYSEIYGIPVSLLGIFAYLAILLILFLEPRLKIAEENGPLAIFGISLVGVAFSAYLTYLEIYVIDAICPFCLASAVITTLIFVLAIIRLAKQTSN